MGEQAHFLYYRHGQLAGPGYLAICEHKYV